MNTEIKSNFVVGTLVARIHSTGWGRNITKDKVAKVYKNGRFILEGDPMNKPGSVGSAQQYRPDTFNPDRATQSGSGHWHRDYVDVWSDAHDNEIANKIAERDTARRVQALTDWLSGKRDGFGRYHITEQQLALLEQALDEPAPVQGSPDAFIDAAEAAKHK